MSSNAYICKFCSSVCPLECLPTHWNQYICHNPACFAHAPSNIDRTNPYRQRSASPKPVSQSCTQSNAFGSAPTLNKLLTAPLSEPTQKEHNRGDNRTGPNLIQNGKTISLKNALQPAPRPNEMAYLFQASDTPSISQIVPGLFIGNIACVDSESLLKLYNISAVISVISRRLLPFPKSLVPDDEPGPHPLEKLFAIKDRMVIISEDCCSANLIQHFDGACEFIHRYRHPPAPNVLPSFDVDAQNHHQSMFPPGYRPGAQEKPPPVAGNVLVHCTMGISRSATVVAAYLMWRRRETAASMLTLMRHQRPKVAPNDGFLDQLLVWQDVCYDIWENRKFCIPRQEYRRLQGRMLDYKKVEKMRDKALTG